MLVYSGSALVEDFQVFDLHSMHPHVCLCSGFL